ncbi:MAG TPA: aminotransferase class III-fold pyridoxal phosphate-dependent enzyme [Methylomirabilota bacterium]|jgi:glutamate-1-semialdehyde 2,1-aminomutase|nr:aminotransferase class III-fold pyridoxal phosphate-dependent enzyme [Methylomirabilota bacterium]
MITRDATERSTPTRPESAAWYERARQAIAGGVGHDLRYATPSPTCIVRGEGAYKWDVDGHRYIDYGLGNGALLLGHAHPAIVAAVREAVGRGTHFGNDHPAQVEWAEAVQRLVPCAERVRFVNSGSEATMLAARLARAFTGRGKLLRFEGHFHGWHDDLATGFAYPFDAPTSLGLAPGAAVGSVMLPANDLDRVADTLARDRDIAGVILEPSGASWGTVPLAPGFLGGLRELTRRHDALLIFDEVVTGFRWAPGGAQQRYGVTPDLSGHAKVIAGGMPGAAVCGRAEVMELMTIRGEAHRDRHRRVMHLGTFNANPVSAAAALACLAIVKTGEPQRQADAVAARLRDGLDAVLDRRGIAGYVYGEASTFHIYVEAAPGSGRARATLPTLDAATLKSIPGPVVTAIQNGFRARGVELLSYTGGLTSAAHSEADVADTVAAFDDLVGELAGRVLARA